MAEKPTLGIGVISLGWMGRLHTRSYKALAERFPDLPVKIKLVAACDPLTVNQDFAVNSLGFDKATGDYQELIEDPEIDVVSICSPNYLHHEIALAAAKAGKAFWIEKPMGINAVQAKEIALAAEEKNLITAVGFNYRHTPAIEQARKLIRSGELGKITNVRCWLIADYASSPDGPLTWRSDRARAGAGVIGDLMSHGADLMQYLVGRIASVNAMTDTFIKERPIPLKEGIGHIGWEISDKKGAVGNEDYVAAMVRFDNGTIGTLESSRVAVGPRAEYIVEVYGTNGSIRWNFERLNELEVCIGQDNGTYHGYTKVLANPHFPYFAKFQPGAGTSMGFDDMKAVEAYQFLQGYLTKKQLAPSVADGWAAAEIDEAMVASAADGAWHSVPEVTGKTTYDIDFN